jgi:hypothetical protein
MALRTVECDAFLNYDSAPGGAGYLSALANIPIAKSVFDSSLPESTGGRSLMLRPIYLIQDDSASYHHRHEVRPDSHLRS